jgi:hypothetical protein
LSKTSIQLVCGLSIGGLSSPDTKVAQIDPASPSLELPVVPILIEKEYMVPGMQNINDDGGKY